MEDGIPMQLRFCSSWSSIQGINMNSAAVSAVTKVSIRHFVLLVAKSSGVYHMWQQTLWPSYII